MADFEEDARAIQQEVRRLLAEKRALETKVDALRATEREIAQSVAEGMKWVEKKKEYDAAKAKARAFVQWCDDAEIRIAALTAAASNKGAA